MMDASNNRFYREKSVPNVSDDLVERLRENATGDWSIRLQHIPLSMVQAADEITSLRVKLAAAEAERDREFQVTKLMATKLNASEAQLATAKKALEGIEAALPVGIVVTFAGKPIDHTKLNAAVEQVREALRSLTTEPKSAP